MNPIHTYQHIAFLIAKERLNTLEESERKELKLWLSENPVNRSLYEKLKNKIRFRLSVHISKFKRHKDFKNTGNAIGHIPFVCPSGGFLLLLSDY